MTRFRAALLTSLTVCNRISDVHRFSAYLGVVATVFALVAAPLFHSHDRDDHGNPTALVHAHFVETHEAQSHHGDEFEAPHGHDRAHWVDFFTFQPPSASFALAIDFSEAFTAPILQLREGVILAEAPRAHSPPDGRLSVPRSPPAA